MEAVRYGDRPEVRARLTQVVENAFDRDHLKDLIEGRALTGDTMDVTRVRAIREEMERADARRLQPHYIASFFLEAFKLLGGKVHEREPKRYEITHVPAVVRNRDRQIGRGDAVLQRYERITFEKELIAVPGKPLAAFICPGHPLLEATIDLIIERNRDLLKRGAVLVDEADPGDQVRTLVYLEHAVQDARVDAFGPAADRLQADAVRRDRQRRETRRRRATPRTSTTGRFPKTNWPSCHRIPEPTWLRGELESRVLEYAAQHLVPSHLGRGPSAKRGPDRQDAGGGP